MDPNKKVLLITALGRMYIIFRGIVRWRFLVLCGLLGITAFLGSHLYPLEDVKFDYSFKRLFHAHGGNQDDLREFQDNFGDDVGLVSILFVLPDADQEVPADRITGSIFEPNVVRTLQRFTGALADTDEIDSDAVFSLTKLAKLHGAVELNFVMNALEALERSCEEEKAWDASTAVAAVEARGPPDRLPPEPVVEAVMAYKEAKASILKHRLYLKSVFNSQGTVTGVIARFAKAYVHDAQRKPILSALMKPDQLSDLDAKRLASIRLDDVLEQLPEGTQAHVSGMPSIQKTYTDITLEDMATFVPLISVAMALLLFLLFRYLWATIFPMVAVGFATVWSVGFMQWQGEPITVMNSVIPVLVLVIGVADAIHIISRYLQVASETDDREHAIAETMVHMAPPCLLAALTTAVGFASLLAANIPAIRSFGAYSAYSILFAFSIQMTLIPIGLSFVRKPDGARVASTKTETGTRFFDWVTHVVLNRPRAILGITAVTLVAAILGVLQVSDESRVLEELHSDHPVSQSLEQTEKHLTGVLVHAVAFRGKAYPDKACAVDTDCIDPACQPDDCNVAGCCATQVCKVVDRTRKMSNQLRLNLADLSGDDQEPVFDAMDGQLWKMKMLSVEQAGGRKPAVAANPSKKSTDVALEDDDEIVIEDDEIAIEDDDEIVIEDEETDSDEIVIEDEEHDPSTPTNGISKPPTSVASASQGHVQRGICIESFKNAEMIHALATIDDWIEEVPAHRQTVSQVSSIVDILREMHFAIQGTYIIPKDIDRAMVENLLKEVKGDGGGLVGRVMTDDYTHANITIRANDEGTQSWAALEHDLKDKLKEVIDENPSLASKFDYSITGSSTLAHGALHSIIDDMSTSIGLAFLFIWLLISVLFRSVRIGFIAMVPNIWPLLITLAFMGYAGMSLRVSSVIIFTISLGIAVDDTIHYLARLREEARRGLSIEDIIAHTTRGTGRAVVLTTVILVTGLSVNGFSEFIAMEQFGLLSAFTLVTALIGVLFLLPVLVQLFRVDKKLV